MRRDREGGVGGGCGKAGYHKLLWYMQINKLVELEAEM